MNRSALSVQKIELKLLTTMEKHTARHLLFLFLLCFFSLTTFGQTGIIKGKIFDEEAALIGASVYLDGVKAKGANSDLNGNFTITGVPVGEQKIVVNYLGYDSKTVTVVVKEGEVTEVNVELQAGIVEGEAVVITGQRRGQTQAINQQLANDNISHIVSSDKIQELPDVNAAEAIGRLPGVALSRSGGEGQKVIIRGMEPKFSAITVNGVRLPSNSSSDRSVDLSLIAPEMLDAIEVFKSPLPDMDAESTAGSVNLRIRKAPEKFRFLTKGLWGYNDLANQFKDYKGVIQTSNRYFKNKLGIIAQGSIERFNRSGDILSNGWEFGRTDTTTGVTNILGTNLRLQDQQEIRKRVNVSLAFDYELNKKHTLSVFSIYSQTNRDRFGVSETYNPLGPSIQYQAQVIENELSLYSLQLTGDHNFNRILVDWSVSSARSNGQTPFNYYMRFGDSQNDLFDENLNRSGHPKTFFDAANPNVGETNLERGEFNTSNTSENSLTALFNVRVPFKLGKKITAEFKTGGKYFQIDREYSEELFSENFYYLGGMFVSNSARAYTERGGELAYLPSNGNLISMTSFLRGGSNPVFVNEEGQEIQLNSNFDPQLIRNWYEAQQDADLLSVNRFAFVERYKVFENILAGYAMIKFKIGDVLTVIPGIRYELSDNEYSGVYSDVNGRYGINGNYRDTTTYQNYDEFLPHLHIKFKPLSWFDVRLSYAQTLSRPDFSFITPGTQINNTALTMRSGNPNLRYSKSTNYDISFSAYEGTLGLLTIGGFYKNIENIFFPWNIFLADPDIATANGWPDFSGFQLSSYTNLAKSEVYGLEIDLQTNLHFLPKPFNGIVLSTNYSRQFSQTEAFFLTSETKLIIPFPPVFETTYTTHTREVPMISMSPHIFHLSVGYDWKKFSARVSGIYQATRASSYALDDDRDRFSLSFWRWDASVKQGIGEKWNIFLNINNFTNQQDITFTRDEEHLNSIQTFGMTGTLGLQFSIQ